MKKNRFPLIVTIVTAVATVVAGLLGFFIDGGKPTNGTKKQLRKVKK